jgi:hypothetical protein
MKRDVLAGLAAAFGLGVIAGAAFYSTREVLKIDVPKPFTLGDLFFPVVRGGAESLPAAFMPIRASTSHGFSSSKLSKSATAPQRAQASVALPFDWISDSTPRDLWGPA